MLGAFEGGVSEPERLPDSVGLPDVEFGGTELAVMFARGVGVIDPDPGGPVGFNAGGLSEPPRLPELVDGVEGMDKPPVAFTDAVSLPVKLVRATAVVVPFVKSVIVNTGAGVVLLLEMEIPLVPFANEVAPLEVVL